MTISEEGKALRAEILKLRPDKRRRYSGDLRRRILDWVERACAAGMMESECGKALGMKTWRFRMWRQVAGRPAKSEGEALAFVPIDTSTLLGMPRAALVTPSGYRVEGLAMEQLAALLRELA